MHLSIFISVINQLDAQNFCFTFFKHMCLKHVEAWNKLIVKQKFCASSWLITEINMHTSFTKLQTIHMHGLVYLSVTNCRPQGDIIPEEYVILLLQIYIYSVRNIYNSNFIYNNMDTVYSMVLAC